MSERAVVSIVCASQPRLLTAIAGRFHDLGCNLADTAFAALAGTAELTTICELPEGLAPETLNYELRRLPELAGGRISVGAYAAHPDERRRRRISHRFEFTGADRPGLLVRLAEAFIACDAEMLRLNTQTLPESKGTTHVILFAVALPEGEEVRCRAALEDTAGKLGLACEVEPA